MTWRNPLDDLLTMHPSPLNRRFVVVLVALLWCVALAALQPARADGPAPENESLAQQIAEAQAAHARHVLDLV